MDEVRKGQIAFLIAKNVIREKGIQVKEIRLYLSHPNRV